MSAEVHSLRSVALVTDGEPFVWVREVIVDEDDNERYEIDVPWTGSHYVTREALQEWLVAIESAFL